MWAIHSVFFPWHRTEREGNESSGENRYTLGQLMKVIAVISHTDSLHPWSDVMRMALYLCLSSPTYRAQSNHEKKQQTNPNWGKFCEMLDLYSTPQNFQGHQKQGKSEKPSQPKRAHGDMTATCTAVSWMVSWMTMLSKNQLINLKSLPRQIHSNSKSCVSSKLIIPANTLHSYPAPIHRLSLLTSTLDLKFDLHGSPT